MKYQSDIMQTNSWTRRHMPLLIMGWGWWKYHLEDAWIKIMELVLVSELINPGKALSPFCKFPNGEIRYWRHSIDPPSHSGAGAKATDSGLRPVGGREQQINKTQTTASWLSIYPVPVTKALCLVPSTVPSTKQDAVTICEISEQQFLSSVPSQSNLK